MAKLEDAARELLTANPDGRNAQLVPLMVKLGFKASSAQSTLSRVRGEMKLAGILVTSDVLGESGMINPMEPVEDLRTDDEIIAEQNERFEFITRMTEGTLDGDVTSLVITGGPGSGKTETIRSVLSQADPGMVADRSGYARATELYRLINMFPAMGQVIAMDDIDSVFDGKDDALPMLKAATDTKKERVISWGSNAVMVDEDGEPLPRSIQYFGAFIVVSNINFEEEIERGTKRAEHLKAFVDRAMFINVEINTNREKLLRMRHIVSNVGMLANEFNMTETESDMVLEFIEEHADKFRDLTLRTALMVAKHVRLSPKSWEKSAQFSLFRRGQFL